MDAYDIVHEISRKSKVKMKEIAGGLGISQQAFYKSLHGSIGFWRMKEIVEIVGYKIAIVDEEGKVIKEL